MLIALYAATDAIARSYWHKCDPIGLTDPQYLILTILWEHDI